MHSLWATHRPGTTLSLPVAARVKAIERRRCVCTFCTKNRDDVRDEYVVGVPSSGLLASTGTVCSATAGARHAGEELLL